MRFHQPEYIQQSLFLRNIESVNVRSNAKIAFLVCHSQALTELDVTGNPVLTHLQCYNNRLSSLDLSRNPLLRILHVRDNLLTSLDLSNNSSLVFFHCEGNPLSEVRVNWATPLAGGGSGIDGYFPGSPMLGFPDVSGATLRVPVGTRLLYAAADVWREFGRIFEVGGANVPVIGGASGYAGKEVTLIGTNLSNSALYIGGESVAIISNTANEIKFIAPVLAGKYELRVVTSVGDSYADLTVFNLSVVSPPVVEYPEEVVLDGSGTEIVVDPVINLGWSGALDAEHHDYIYAGAVENTIVITFEFPVANSSGVDQPVELELSGSIASQLEIPVGLRLSAGASSLSVEFKLKAASGFQSLLRSLRADTWDPLVGSITAKVPDLHLVASSPELKIYDRFSYDLEYAAPGINYVGYLSLNLAGGSPDLQININGRGWESAYPGGDYIERTYLGSELSDLSQPGSVIYLKDVNTGSSVTVIPVTTGTLPPLPIYRTVTLHIPDGIEVESPASNLVVSHGSYEFKLSRPLDGIDSLVISLSSVGIPVVSTVPSITLVDDVYHVIISNITSNLDVTLTFLTSTSTVSLPSPSISVSLIGSTLSVLTPSKEALTLYSLRGSLLYHASKEKGSTTINVSRLPRGVLIVRGSSGWVRKVFKQ